MEQVGDHTEDVGRDRDREEARRLLRLSMGESVQVLAEKWWRQISESFYRKNSSDLMMN